MIYTVYTRWECIFAAVRAYHRAPGHCPVILMSNMRRANRRQHNKEEIDDLIIDGVHHELWAMLAECQIKWNDRPYEYFYDNGGGYRALCLDVYFRPGTLEWQRAEEELAPELRAEKERRRIHHLR